MPEGHVLHRLACELRELVGSPVGVSSPQGRFPDAGLLDGRVLQAAEAYGKHLFLRFDPSVVHVHLGMQGKFLRLTPPPPPRPQVRLRLLGAEVAWDLIAPSRCELLSAGEAAGLVARSGPDPLEADADPELVWKHLQGHAGPVGAALIDQSVIAGVGNVLRAEVLLLTGVRPERPVGNLSRPEFDHLWSTLRSMMQRAVEEGRILSLETPASVERTTLPEADGRYVYKQSHCRRCGTPVVVSSVGGRSAYACPRCQR